MKIQKEKGITLIALVITIIILLILAGVAIMALNNIGLFEKAQIADERYSRAEAQEGMQLILKEYQIEKVTKKTTLEDYLNRCKESERISDLEKKDSDFIVEYKGYDFIIKGDGKLANADDGGSVGNGGTDTSESFSAPTLVRGMGPDVDTVSVANNHEVGDRDIIKIEYGISKDNKKYRWQTDSRFVDLYPNTTYYIRTKITEQVLEDETETVISNAREITTTDFEVSWTLNIVHNLKDKIGTQVKGYGDGNWEILYAGRKFSNDGQNHVYLISTTNRKSGYKPANYYSTDVDAVVEDANKLSAWWNKYGKTSINNNNAKATCYMLTNTNFEDATKIGDFKDDNASVKYVIGGPTDDLFFESWNAKNGLEVIVNDNGTYKSGNGFMYTRDGVDFNSVGYRGGNGGNARYGVGTYASKSTYRGFTITSGTVYSRGFNYWLASPYFDGDGYYFYTGNYVGSSQMTYGYNGLRPVVCLNADAEFEE